jgi:chromosome segregation ATPase
LEEEQARKTQQMERAALEAEQQARQLRADVEASKTRMASAELEYGTRLQEAEQVRKEKERALQEAVKSANDERIRLDKEHARRLNDAESRADAAVRDAVDFKRKLEEAMEQLEARKRQRVDPTLTSELEQIRFERNSLQRTMTLREDELRALKTENAKITKQLRETERKLDSETTTLRLEYESRLAELERRQMHAASSSDEE